MYVYNVETFSFDFERIHAAGNIFSRNQMRFEFLN